MIAEIKNLVKVGDKIEKKKNLPESRARCKETIDNRKKFFKRNQPTSK